MTRWMRRFAGAVVLALSMVPGLAGAQVTLTPAFSSPATNASPGASFEGLIAFSPSGSVITASVTAGTEVVPQTNVSVTVDGTNATVTLVPLTNSYGTVSVEVMGVSGATTSTASFQVEFQAAGPRLSLGFSSPATNSAPGARFQGSVYYSPTGTLTVTIDSGTAIVPQSNVQVAAGSTNALITLIPLTNQSGTVSVDVEFVAGGVTTTRTFSVVFRPYPPTISAIGTVTIPEDRTTNVNFSLADPDTQLNALVLTASSSNTVLIDSGDWSFGGGSDSNRYISLTPNENMNGTSMMTVAVSDGTYTNTRSFSFVVTPVPDPPTVSGAVSVAFNDNIPATNIFPNVVISDVDHNRPLAEQLVLTVTLSSDQYATLANGTATFTTTGSPSQVTTAITNLAAIPRPFRGAPGDVNAVSATITVKGVQDNLAVTNAVTLSIQVMNTRPSFQVNVDPTSVVEGLTIQPFTLSYIYDPDAGDEMFSLLISLVNGSQTNLVTLSPASTLIDNITGLQASIRNVSVQARSGALTNAFADVPLLMELTDMNGGRAALTNTIRVVQAQNPPSIAGVPPQIFTKTDSDAAFKAFEAAYVTDPDEGGLQQVRAFISQSRPDLGTFSETSKPFATPTALSAWLQGLLYEPTPGALPVGQVADSVFTITVFDVTGLWSQNSSARVRITGVNNAPRILNVPQVQPVLIPPVAPLYPFAGIAVTNDDTNSVRFTVAIDNTSKGALGNLGSFVESSPGVFEMSGQPVDIVHSLTSIVYTLSTSYLFPPDDPGGTVFTLSARDYALLTRTTNLYIQVQDTPRNHLVVRALNDGLPGSLSYALANAGNNDFITFALPSYPAVVRMSASAPATLIRNISIKGPGANLLTISGDINGDDVPDRQIFRVRSRVSIEGVTLARGTASFGGAILVESNGVLTLRNCAVVDSVAAQYGGAIDVDGGKLTLDGCFIGRNRLSTDTGLGGAGVSVYSDQDVELVNTTFAANEQPNVTGDGGGALVVQNRTQGIEVNAAVVHCTFVENADASGRASAALSVDFGTVVRPWNSIFGDFSGRNLDVAGAADVISMGGNLCDDSTRTVLTQQGQSREVFLLDHLTDLTLIDPLLKPLDLASDPTPVCVPRGGSPAIGHGPGASVEVDQRGVIRDGQPDSGAAEAYASGRVVLNEVCFDGTGPDFVEIYVRRDSGPVNLAPYALFLDGVKVHEFAQGKIIGTNALFSAGATANNLVKPGFGMVVAFTTNPVMLTSISNVTPVVRPSATNISMALPSHGLLSMGPADGGPIAMQSYLGTYLSPATGTNLLNTSGASISLAPQFRGFSLVPHGLISPGPFSGIDEDGDPLVPPMSPGASADRTPFGQPNALPLARADVFTVTEDDPASLALLANDFDGDGNDRLVIVDVSAVSDPGTGDVSATSSALGAAVVVDPAGVPVRGERAVYDPRVALALQSLPVGVEILDSFRYEIIDLGSAPVEGYSATGTVTAVAATNHRLSNGVAVVISGAVPTNYNGTFAVTAIGDNAFSIPVPFAGPASENGSWETAEPRAPSSRSEAACTVRVIGVNDPPVAVPDTITGVTERLAARIMVRPERAGDVGLTFPEDPVPAPAMLAQSILDNDVDVDSDGGWASLRAVGVLGRVNAILGYSGTEGETPVAVHAPGHGLSSGDEVVIANYGGHPSYNGAHVVTVLDEDSFSIPCFFVDDAPVKGVWIVLTEVTRYEAVTDAGASVNLGLRAAPEEDGIVYDPTPSAFLRGLAEGEPFIDRFWYVVEDRHGAVGIAPVDVTVIGVNDTPVANPDPDALRLLDLLSEGTNGLDGVLDGGLDLMYVLPPSSGGTGFVDLMVLDLTGTVTGTIALADMPATDEDTPLGIGAPFLLANDTDVDRIDHLNVVAVDPLSREGAAVSLSGGVVTYDPTGSSPLQALAREERVIDSFCAVISDGMPGGLATSRVAVLVVGVNDTPVANPEFHVTHEDEVFVFDPRTNDVDIDIDGNPPDDRLRIVAATNVPNPGNARVDMATTNVAHDATVSELLNQLADWQSFTNVFDYEITDNSFLFAVDDDFHVPAGTMGRTLDVLANDRDFTDADGGLTIIAAGPALWGGTVVIGSGGSNLVYSSPPGFAGDDYFRYTVRNSEGDVDSGRVMVRSVVPRLNGVLYAGNDQYAVAAGETVSMAVTDNDDLLPQGGAGLQITALLDSSVPGQPLLTNNVFVFAATNGLDPLWFRYQVSGGGTSTGQAEVLVTVVDRRGALNVRDDSFSVLPDSFDNELDVLANDALVGQSVAALRIREILVPAAHGSVTTNASATSLVYTPDAGFIGLDPVRYLVSDGLGGTGEATASIRVGTLVVVPDFFKILATTNALPVSIDVLGNDRIMPSPRSTLSIVSVSPPLPTAIGTMQVGGAGSYLVFTPSNVQGQLEFSYAVQDGGSPARTATGRVTIATVPSGVYANPDQFAVRGGEVSYVLNVLTNDISYPSANKTYSILSIGVGADAPDRGGLVSIVDNQLVYIPAPGFFGEESFKYTMTDSVGTDVTRVTVSVRPGDLSANDDRYAVYYEVPGGASQARSFSLPVLWNDRILPPLDQVAVIAGLGAGSNGPSQGGSVTIAADGQSLTYRPTLTLSTGYVERFTYEISDGGERRASATVWVTVLNRSNELAAVTQDDAFGVECGSASNLLPVLANDFVLPGSAAGWTITAVSPSLFGATLSISGPGVRYTPPAGFVGIDRFDYRVSDGLGGTGEATVFVRVGSLPTVPDAFVVLAGSANNELDVAANDPLSAPYDGQYVLGTVFGLTAGGTAGVSGDNRVLYTPDPGYAGPYPYTEEFGYTVADDVGIVFTGAAAVIVTDAEAGRNSATVTLLVEGRNDEPVIENDPPNTPITDKETSLPFVGVTIIEVDQQTLEPIDVTVTIDDPVKGRLINLGPFVDAGGGRYVLTNVTGAAATLHIRQLVYVPVENRITVPTTETVRFTISVTDNKSEPVVDTQTAIDVTAVNDPPIISGTVAGQRFYYRTPIRPFAAVLVTEVDDLTLQPLAVTVTIAEPAQGSLTNTGSFLPLGDGVYRAVNVTAAAATAQLRAMEFWSSATNLAVGASITTHLSLTVEDGFAAPVQDLTTSVIAVNAYQTEVRPDAEALQGAFGLAVDAIADFAVVGAPNATYTVTNCGAAFVYRYQVGTSNTWNEWRQLLPATITTNDQFGRSIGISESLIAAGAPQQRVSGVQSGTVYVFRRDLGGENNWGEWLRIAPTNMRGASRFGLSVDVGGDLLAVGAPDADLTGGGTNAGAVVLYGRHQGGLNAWGEIMRWAPVGAASIDADFGWSVALSGDTLIVGAPGYNANTGTVEREGAAFHFERNAGGSNRWGLIQTITATETNLSRTFGWDVAVSTGALAVGAYRMQVGAVSEAGRTYLYERAAPTGVFAYIQQLDRRTDGERRFGYNLAIDENLLLVGAPENASLPNIGAAYLYRHSGVGTSAWQLIEVFRPPTNSLANLYGRAIGFRQGTAIVGAPASSGPGGANNRGQAFIYRFDYTDLDAKSTPLTAYDIWRRDYFGDALLNPDLEALLWGGLADPDGDGSPNDDEYAFVGNPTIFGDVGNLSIWRDEAGGDMVLQYARRGNDPSIDFILSGSTNLVDWFDLSGVSFDEQIVPLGVAEIVTLQAALPAAYRNLFIKVRAEW